MVCSLLVSKYQQLSFVLTAINSTDGVRCTNHVKSNKHFNPEANAQASKRRTKLRCTNHVKDENSAVFRGRHMDTRQQRPGTQRKGSEVSWCHVATADLPTSVSTVSCTCVGLRQEGNSYASLFKVEGPGDKRALWPSEV